MIALELLIDKLANKSITQQQSCIKCKNCNICEEKKSLLCYTGALLSGWLAQCAESSLKYQINLSLCGTTIIVILFQNLLVLPVHCAKKGRLGYDLNGRRKIASLFQYNNQKDPSTRLFITGQAQNKLIRAYRKPFWILLQFFYNARIME